MANVMRLGGGGGGSGVELNIDYGLTPPSDVSKLWVPLDSKPSFVELNGEFMPYGDDYIDTTWTDAPTMPKAMVDVASAKIGTKIYLFGGMIYNANGTTSYSSAIYIYDTVTNTYTTSKAVLAVAARNLCVAAYGTKVYIFGAYGSTTSNIIQEYDTVTDTIKTKSAVINFQCLWGGRAIAYKKYIYTFGGMTSTASNGMTNYIGKYDVEADTFEITMSRVLPTKIYNTGVMLANGIIYIVGGMTSMDIYRGETKIYSFNPETEAVSTLSVTLKSNQCAGCGYAAFGNKMYLFGGSYYYSSDSPTNKIQVFDADSMQTSTLDDTLPTTLARCTCATVDDHIYIFGGGTSPSLSTSKPALSTTQRFTVRTVLPYRHLKIFTDMFSRQTAIINTDKVKLYTTIREAYIGNSDNYAKLTAAYIHNGSTWQSLEGVSVTQDMLNALAELGVS